MGRKTASRAFCSYNEITRNQKTQNGSRRRAGDENKKFGMCSLCLSANVKRPVISPVTGSLYCKQCILENFLQQRKEINALKKQYKLYLEQRKQQKELEKREQEMRQEQFLEQKLLLPTTTTTGGNREGSSASARKQNVSSVKTGSDSSNGLGNNFWLKSSDAKNGTIKMKKPRKYTVDPMSKGKDKKLGIKDLVEVTLTLEPSEDKNEDSSMGGAPRTIIDRSSGSENISAASNSDSPKYMCATCSHSFLQNSEAYVIRPSGHCICANCYNRFVKNVWKCPVTGKTMSHKENDSIRVNVEATSYAASGDVETKQRVGPAFQVS